MSETTYIQDDFGNQIPLLDAHGNLSVQVMMLYAEDKLTETDRKTVQNHAATDEMAKDALEGFASTTNPARTRHHLSQLNAEIQKRSGATSVTAPLPETSDFDYRKLAAAITLLLVISGAMYVGSRFFSKSELADNAEHETAFSEDAISEKESALETPFEEPAAVEEAEEAVPVVQDQVSQTTIPTQDAKKTDLKEETSIAEKAVKNLAKEQGTEKVTAAATSRVDPSDDMALADSESPSARSAAKAMTESAGASDASMDQEAATVVQGTSMAVSQTKDLARAESELRAAPEQQQREKPAKEKQSQTQTATAGASAALYPGGDISMYRFIEKKKIYTEAMRAQNLKGSVTVSFDIEADGRVSNASIKSGINGPLNEDALRVVRSMPKWTAAKNAAGEPMKSSKTVIIKYGE